MEERYADAQDGPGAVAGGGGEWKQSEATQPEENKLKRGRSPDEDEDDARVRLIPHPLLHSNLLTSCRPLVRVWTAKRTTECKPGVGDILITGIFIVYII